jgi:hypothetical protein
VADRIGAEGHGMRVNFDASLHAPASAPINGNILNIGSSFFNPAALNGATQAYVIFHEGGHSAGLDDVVLPAGAAGLGRTPMGEHAPRAYGVGATNWLGAHAPDLAVKNNENYTCLIVPLCGGP